MFRSIFFVLLYSEFVLSSVEHRPREIETGPNGNIVINLGGTSDPRQFQFPIFRLLRAKVPNEPQADVQNQLTKLADESSTTKRPTSLPYVNVDISTENYDYESFDHTGEGKETKKTSGPKIRKPKRAKSKRVSLVEFIKDLIEPSQSKTQRTTIEPPQNPQAKAFGAHVVRHHQGQVLKPLAQAKAGVNVDAYVMRPKNHHAKLGTIPHISSERKSINSGCQSWDEFEKISSTLTPLHTHDVDIQIEKRSQPLENSNIGDAKLTSATFDLKSKENQVNDPELPLPECYRNQQGFVCCNRVLEELIYRTSDYMLNANVNKCNSQIFSQLLKNMAEKQFQTAFEIIVANGDFVSKVRFKDNLICKTVTNNKFVIIYATSQLYELAPYNRREPLTSV
ncbi:Ground-like domain-containing protein [Aphelenchoides besseyi]|nr:Ground-like domain-containing protein [Aphelenchoides besseyi]